MRGAFVNLFLKGGADKMKPVDALALFYDNIDLTPIGPDGDEMIRRMSDRLVAVDLLGPAANLLAYQVDKRLDGIAKAQVATKLAAVYLMDHKPDKAVATIRDFQITGLPDEEMHERMLLQARAFAALKQWDNALDLIAVDQSDDTRACAPISIGKAATGRWPARSPKNCWQGRWTDAVPLTITDRGHVLRAAVAYSLANDEASLARLRANFGAKMKGTPDGNLFAVLSAEHRPAWPGLPRRRRQDRLGRYAGSLHEGLQQAQIGREELELLLFEPGQARAAQFLPARFADQPMTHAGQHFARWRGPHRARRCAPRCDGGLMRSSLPVRNSSGAVTASASTALAWRKSSPQFMISKVARPDSGTKRSNTSSRMCRGQFVQRMGQRHIAAGFQHLIPIARLQMHRLGGADLEQGGGRHAPWRRRRQQNQRTHLEPRRQHLRQQSAHGMPHQNGRPSSTLAISSSRSSA